MQRLLTVNLIRPFLALASFTSASCFAQSGDTLMPVLVEDEGYPVSVGGKTLTMPYAGGVNSVSISNIDFNGDGMLDLFLFERETEHQLALVRQANGAYMYEPKYIKPFEQLLLKDWVLLRDYDNDGDQDLFTAGRLPTPFVDFIENIGSDTAPEYVFRFELSTRYDPDSIPNPLPKLYCPSTDIPGIADMDADGDLDFLVYEVTGIRVNYHRNFAVENYGRTDTFDLVLASSCWGHMLEQWDGATNSYDLRVNQPPCLGEIGKTDHLGKVAHAGGSILPIDLNGDQLMDVVVSDVGVNYMVAGFNGGTQTIASMTSKDTLFPSNTTRIDIKSFPAGYYVDIGGSSARELVLAPNEYNFVEGRNGIWLYDNTGTDAAPVFEFNRKGFLQDQMLDGGKASAPLFIDYDNDGDKDLFLAVGERVDTESPNPNQGRGYIQVHENVGSDSMPLFEQLEEDYFKLLTNAFPQPLTGIRLAAADLDGDEDIDLLVGTDERKFHYFENTTSGELSFDYVTDNYDALNTKATWFRPAPELFDLDQDGDFDLLVGTIHGYIRYFENTGTPTQPNFTFVTDSLGSFAVIDPPDFKFAGDLAPRVIDYDFDGQPELLAGNISGKVFVFDSLETALTAPMPLMFQTPIQTHSRRNTAPAYLKTHADSGWVVVGELGGGVFSYRHQLELFDKDSIHQPADTLPKDTTSRENRLTEMKVILYPNPTDANFSIQADRPAHFRVFDLMGRELLTDELLPDSPKPVNLQHLSAGYYLVQVTDGRAVVTRRVLKVE